MALSVPNVAVTVALPAVAAAVNSPDALMVPAVEGLTDHVTGTPTYGLPVWSFTVAVNCCVAPVPTLAVIGLIASVVGTGAAVSAPDAAKPSYVIAASPPSEFSSSTTAVPCPERSATTAYWVSSVRPLTLRGSTFTLPPLTSDGTYCVTASVPSAKRYQRSVALVAPADCSTMGVVQPVVPPSVRVMFGR